MMIVTARYYTVFGKRFATLDEVTEYLRGVCVYGEDEVQYHLDWDVEYVVERSFE